MPGGAKYKIARKRRREAKTNYRKRYVQVLSRKLRMVVRRSNKYIEAMIVEFNPKGDIIKVSAHSIELKKKYGWLGSGSSTMAAYLTGYLLGKRALEKGIQEAVPDIGLRSAIKGSRVFAAIKGAIDAGLNIPASEEVFPSAERIRGEHVAAYAKMLRESSPEAYQKQFSLLIRSGLEPENYPAHFEEVLQRIKSGKDGGE